MIEPGLPLAAMIAANAVMAIGSALQASVGIGLALLAVPFLALIDPHLVPGPMLLAASLVAFASAWRDRHALEVKSFGLSLLGLAIGTVAGAVALSAVNAAYLNKVFAVLVLLAVALSVSGLHVRPTQPALFLGGGASGLMGTMAGIHGPPMALVLQNARPERARAMLGAFFFVAYVGSVLALAAVGLFGMLELKLAAALLPGVVAGVLVAPLLARHLSPARLRVAILGISATSALVLLFR
jgi:uncharacterized membrane protein YfcA